MLKVCVFLLSIILLGCHQKLEVKENGAFQALQMRAHQQSYPFKDLTHAAYFKEILQFQNLSAASSRQQFPEPWESIGPHNIAGRTLAISLNPQNHHTLYAGSAGGGLWRSYNQGKGTSWQQVSLGYPVLAVSSIAFAPDDSLAMYIGTGEVYNANQSGNGAAFRATRGTYGIGILKTIDGGINWTKSLDWSYDLNRGIHAVKVAPSNSSIVYAGTTDGVFKSNDAGTSWSQVHEVIIANDLVIHPENPDIVIVGCGNLGSPNGGIYKTTDGGENWTYFQPIPYNGKIQLAVDPSNSSVIYASVGNGFSFSNGATWLYKSNDGGDTWNVINTRDYSKWQGWFAHDVAVNPNDSNKLTTIGIEIYASEDGGETLNQTTVGGVALGTPPISGPDGPPNFTHSDHHDIVYDQNDGNFVYVANDGGVYASEDGGQTWESRNGGMQTTQFYNGFSVFQSEDITLAMGGLQDNSTIEYTGSKAWNRVIGGDGSWTALHSSNSDIRYGSFQNLNIYRTDDGLFYGNINAAGSGIPTAFIAPFVVATSEPKIVYAGRNRVIKSTNGGDDWSIQSTLGEDFLLSMDVSPTDSDYLYVATAPNAERTRVWRTNDGGGSYNEITGDLPDAYINDIHVNPNDPEKVYLTFGGFGGAHVFFSNNGGEDWSDITGNLPAIPTSAILVDPLFDSIIYVGNDFGVFYTKDQGKTWNTFMDGLIDAVLVMDLKLNVKTRKIYVATHGSGAFERDMIELDLPSNIVDHKWNQAIEIIGNPASDQIMLKGIDKESHFKLFDSAGHMLKNGLVSVNGQIDVQEIPSGIYFLKIRHASIHKSLKLIIQH